MCNPICLHSLSLLTQVVSPLLNITKQGMVTWRQAMAIAVTIGRIACFMHVLNYRPWSFLLITRGLQIPIAIGGQAFGTRWTDSLGWRISIHVHAFFWSGIGNIIKLFCIKKAPPTASCPSYSMLVSRLMEIWLAHETVIQCQESFQVILNLQKLYKYI